MRKKNVVNFIALISMIGILFGTMMMIIVLSVFNGFDRIIQDLYEDVDSDIRVELNEGQFFSVDDNLINSINNIKGVNHCSEVLEYKMLAKYLDYQQVVDGKGVDDNYRNVNNLEKHMILGEYQTLAPNFLIAGSGVFNALSLKLLDFEDPLELSIFTNEKNILNPNSFVKTKAFYPTAVFSSQVEIDNSYVILDINTLREFVGLSRSCSALDISVNKHDQKSIKNQLMATLGSKFVIKNRTEQRPFVNKMIRTEKLVVYIIFIFILLISMFSLFGTLVVLLMEKQNDIQVLSSLGFPLKRIQNIFLYVGVIVTLSGVLFGSFLGFLLCFLQYEFGWIKLGSEGGFFIESYPIEINFADIILIQIIVLLLGFVTSYFVSRQQRFYPI
jgi:lipoprotein-releasing system permease protein